MALAKDAIRPEIGMGATEMCWSDRHPWTVVAVYSENKCMLQKDSVKAKEGDHPMGHQEWEITPNPQGITAIVTRRRNGQWHHVNRAMNTTGFVLGQRRYYYDWSF